MTNATAKPRTRKAPGKALVPKGPCVGFEAVEHLIWRARVASAPPAVYVDLSGFDNALAANLAAEEHDLAERWARDVEYDQRESVLRGQRPVKPAPARHVPVAVVTRSGAFYKLNSRGEMEAAPMDEKAEKHMAEILRLHAEEDGTLDDPGPAAVPVLDPPTHREDTAGPGSPPDDPALDEATDEQP